VPSKTRKLLLVGVVLAGLGLAALMLSRGRVAPLAPLPSPNGYDDFVKAGQAVVGEFGDYPTFDQDRLRGVVSSNAEALRLVRLGLGRRCSLATDSAMTNVSGMLSELANLKRLAHLLAAEGRLRALEGRPPEAALAYTDAVRFGNEMSRGGFMINRLVGIACEAIGCGPLSKLVPALKPEEARPLIQELEKLDQGRITWGEVQRNESRFHRYQLAKRYFNPVLWVTGWWQSRAAKHKAEARHQVVVAHERLVMTELALRCFQAENGRMPERLDEIVTNCLAKVPDDPFSGRPLVYRPRGTNWLLYSVGTDGVDDGGRPAGRGLSASGDILFDSPW